MTSRALLDPCTTRAPYFSYHVCNSYRMAAFNPCRYKSLGLSVAISWESSFFCPSFRLRTRTAGIRKALVRYNPNIVQASLLGVGAPELLVIGVVALLVFGPKGLAELARNLGQTLRAFQPTIREIQEVSREFKQTLEKEIGLDELEPLKSGTLKPSSPSQASIPVVDQVESKPVATEDYANVPEEQLKSVVPEEQLKGINLPVESKPFTTEDYAKVTEEQLKSVVPEDQLKDPAVLPVQNIEQKPKQRADQPDFVETVRDQQKVANSE